MRSPANPQTQASKVSAHASSTAERLPRQLHPRRRQRTRFLFRFFLGICGAALVLLPLALPQSWIASIFGLGMFLVSILLPPARSAETGAAPEIEPAHAHSPKIILKGADFFSGDPIPTPVQIFVSENQILAIKPDLQPAVIVPTAEVTSAFLQRLENSWLLVLIWAGNETTFSFRGIHCERNARRAQAAIRTFLRPAPLQKAKARAAGA
ncbi:MAG: hypothetical protein JSS69_03160 [Acidobacteria bacterium]|nr:hypothetical protein [Acidobacteriota bacterium]MBS1864892.1 hypothetical protein [Acidobacteriota bacterium]